MCDFTRAMPQRIRQSAAAFSLTVLGCIGVGPQIAAAQTALPGTIQGSVAAFVTVLPMKTGPSPLVFVPDMEVWARNTQTGQTSAHVTTNAEGYFRSPELAPGEYQICVTGKGYATRCDDSTISVSRPTRVLNHIIEIRPLGDAIRGTVWLADRTTPCFWFRPAMNPVPLIAKVSLLDSGGQVVAGPVSGNAAGQYVLPLGDSASKGTKLRAQCDAGMAEVSLLSRTLLQDLAIPNHAPTILSLDLTQGGVGVRRADAGATVRATVQASDLDGENLHYRWVDDSGRKLGLPDAPAVDWKLLDAIALNTLHVQVTDGRGGFATASRTLQSGPNSLFFSGHVFARGTHADVGGATVQFNKVSVLTDARGNFKVSVPDAPQFVLNVTKAGFALNSQVLRTLAINIQVPLDAVQIATVSGGAGGPVSIPKGSGGACGCPCETHGHARGHYGGDDKVVVETDHTRITVDRIPRRGDDKGGTCGAPQTASSLDVTFPPNAFVTSGGTLYTGAVSVEGFQYDLSQTNPIPGDMGGIFQGKAVRLGTFGAFHITAHDAAGSLLAMAPGKGASISMPIQDSQLGVAPATIPFFSYDESTGQWIEEGTLTRNGNRYIGEIKHFSAFNADTQFDGGACVKVVLDSSFALPVTLDASYFDSSVGSFHHNGTTASQPVIGVERMRPNQNFTLTITDAASTTVSVVLYSGPGLDPVPFPGGLDTDQVNFSHCNGPVQVYNNVIPAAIGSRPYFLGPVFSPGTAITDNSAAYQAATNAQTGAQRNTLNGWKQANGFHIDGSLVLGEATAIYFNNGDLKFGRDMHCRQTNTTTNATACYVSNFGTVGTDDAVPALASAEQYEAASQAATAPQPTATVAMEYDPVKGVQFFAYDSGGNYLAQPALDSEGPKPMPDMCMACHNGAYNGGTNVNNGAYFLPFDLSSFLNDANQTFPSAPPSAQVQEQFRQLNNMVAATNPPAAVIQLINLWYPGGVGTANQQFQFGQGAAQLPSAPFAGHEPLYDTVVAPVCRTCHASIGGLEWNTFAQMNSVSGLIQFRACGPNYLIMPHAEVPWVRFWQQSLSSTLASDLALPGGCPNH